MLHRFRMCKKPEAESDTHRARREITVIFRSSANSKLTSLYVGMMFLLLTVNQDPGFRGLGYDHTLTSGWQM